MKKEKKEGGLRRTKILFSILVILTLIVIHNDELLLTKAKYEIRDYPEILMLAHNITQDCNNDRACYYDTIRDYVLNHKTRTDGILLDWETNDPLFTLEYGNDCDGKAVLAIDLLKALGERDIYFVLQESNYPDGTIIRHACWMAKPFKDHNAYMLYNCINEADIVNVKKMV